MKPKLLGILVSILAFGLMIQPSVRAQTSTFVYQGKLNYQDAVLNGRVDLQFRLYNAASNGNVVGSTPTVVFDDLAITDGLVTVELDFGADAFDGNPRWLEIGMRVWDGTGAYTLLSPRQPITPAPYAMRAMVDEADDSVSWSEISGIVGTGSSQVASGDHNHLGQTWSGEASAGLTVQNEVGTGVVGESSSSLGIGVYGHASSATGTTYGVYGQSASATGYGVYAQGTATDLGLANGTIRSDRVSGSDLNLYSNDEVEVHLDDDGDSHSSFTVYDGEDQVAFQVSETGEIRWKERTGYVSISAAAFGPFTDGREFWNRGDSVYMEGSTCCSFYAPVQLPHGAEVTKLTFKWEDFSMFGDSKLTLYRNHHNGSSTEMAEALSTNFLGLGQSYDDTIDTPSINNSVYSYYLHLGLPTANIKCFGAIIEYTCTSPY